jgi:hypothetical protein
VTDTGHPGPRPRASSWSRTGASTTCTLAKYDGRWMIVNVLWQSTPPQELRRIRAAASPSATGGLCRPRRRRRHPSRRSSPIRRGSTAGHSAPDGPHALLLPQGHTGPGKTTGSTSSHLIDGRWAPATRMDLGGNFSDLYPSVTSDGKTDGIRLLSYRAAGDTSSHRERVPVVHRAARGDGWGPPVFMLARRAGTTTTTGRSILPRPEHHVRPDDAGFTAAPRKMEIRWNGKEIRSGHPWSLVVPSLPWRSWRPL